MQSIYREIAPFDLILFKGTDFISRIVKTFESLKYSNTEYSHVGIIVNSQVLPFIKNLELNKFYVIESILSSKLDNNKERFGIQIRELEDIIKTYSTTRNTKIAWAPLLFNPWKHIQSNEKSLIIKTLYDLYQNINKKSFKSIFPCLNSSYKLDEILIAGHKLLNNILLSKKIEHLEPGEIFIFSSKLVTMIYKAIGVLESCINNIDPIDYIEYRKFPKIVEIKTLLVPKNKSLIELL